MYLFICLFIYLSFCSIFDLQSCNPDPLLPSLLDRTPPDELDAANEEERQLHRIHSVFSIYPIQQVTIKFSCKVYLFSDKSRNVSSFLT